MDEKELKRKIADNLRVIRAKNRLSQDKLSELSGVSQKYITKIENELVNPSILIIAKLAEALKVTVNDIVG